MTTRRSFIKSTTAATAAVGLAATIPAAMSA
nr:twin-arginine translocation signal domain-containing protein [Sunxiuqinia sp.]